MKIDLMHSFKMMRAWQWELYPLEKGANNTSGTKFQNTCIPKLTILSNKGP